MGFCRTSVYEKYNFEPQIQIKIWCIGKSTSGKKYQVEYGTFSLGKSTILVLFPIGTFSLNNKKKYHIVLIVTLTICKKISFLNICLEKFPKKLPWVWIGAESGLQISL